MGLAQVRCGRNCTLFFTPEQLQRGPDRRLAAALYTGHELGSLPRAFSGELDPVHRRKCVGNKDKS